ncbi:MAG TPA: hypothetical protein VN112_12020 [Ensifer sp.]|nr:hypothetical protein [Ensifer sp.]
MDFETLSSANVKFALSMMTPLPAGSIHCPPALDRLAVLNGVNDFLPGATIFGGLGAGLSAKDNIRQ